MSKLRIVALSAVAFLVLFSGTEFVRAKYYHSRVADFKNSVAVLSMTDRIERLSKAVEGKSNSLQCNISTELLVQTKQPDDETNKSPELLSREVAEFAQAASPAPSFNSFAQFIPGVKQARQESIEIDYALTEIQHLTREEDSSLYCTELVNSLSEVYYISTLSTPQGVSALHVAQQENFKENVSIAQRNLADLKVPTIFADQHVQVNDYLNSLRLDLEGDVANYEQFSRAIERNTEVLETIFFDIAEKSNYLAGRIDKLLINSGTLQ